MLLLPQVSESMVRTDPERVADLYFRIAKSYTNAPEVRSGHKL